MDSCVTETLRLLVAILWVFATAGDVAGEDIGLLPQADAPQQIGKLAGDGLLDLLEEAPAHVGTLLRQQLETGDGVDAKEVLVSLAVGEVKFATLVFARMDLKIKNLSGSSTMSLNTSSPSLKKVILSL